MASDIVSQDWSAHLRAGGMRVTKQRIAVLEAVTAHPHITVDELLATVETRLPGISFQSIYTVVNSLVEAQILRRLDVPHSAARYEVEAHDNHHHVVCRQCLRIEDVACAQGQAPCLHPSNDHGMQIDTADVLYRGLCAECASQISDSTTETSSVRSTANG